MIRLATSTLSNQSLVTALLCHTYTADADRSIFVRLFADQISGNGNYTAYLTIQRLGAGSEYRALPITTTNAASGVTAIAFSTIAVPVKNTDVLKVYLLGLAGDTTTPDIITEIWEDDAVLNSVWTNAKAALIDVAISSRAATGAQMDLVNAPNSTALTAVAAAVWNRLTSTLTVTGSIGKYIMDMIAAIWAYASRTLTQSAAAVEAAVSGDSISVYRGDSLGQALTNVGTLTGYTSLWFTVKQHTEADADTAAIIQIKKNASGSGDGLLYLNKIAVPNATEGTLAADGSITIQDEASGDITPNLKAADMAKLTPGTYTYDIQVLISGIVTTYADGDFIIKSDSTRAVS